MTRFVIVTRGATGAVIIKDGKDISHDVVAVDVFAKVGEPAHVHVTYLAESVIVDTDAHECRRDPVA